MVNLYASTTKSSLPPSLATHFVRKHEISTIILHVALRSRYEPLKLWLFCSRFAFNRLNMEIWENLCSRILVASHVDKKINTKAFLPTANARNRICVRRSFLR